MTVHQSAETPEGEQEHANNARVAPSFICELWKYRLGLLMVLDCVAVFILILVAYWLRFNFELPYLDVVHQPPSLLRYAQWGGMFAILWTVTVWREGGYRSDIRGFASRITRIRSAVLGGVYAGCVLLAASFLYRDFLLSRFVFVIGAFLGGLSMIGMRTALALAEKYVDRCTALGRRLVVVGTGSHAREFIKRITADDRVGNVIGVLTWNGEVGGDTFEGVPVLGDLEEVKDIWSQQKFDEAFLSPSDWHYLAEEGDSPLTDVVDFFHSRKIPAFVIPPTISVSMVQREAGLASGTPVLRLKEVTTTWVQDVVKRIFDLLIGSLVAVVGVPIWLLIAVAIKMDSNGPVFYGQKRLRGNELFTAWKFRTMVQDAEEILEDYLTRNPDLREEWEKTHKLKNDPRVTRVGKFLRKTSLDEIPQLWNVLKGEMSLVGPRPIVMEEKGKYGERFSLYEHVKPGITGLWQVSGRTDTSYEERIYLDAYYVRNWSVWLDLYIIFKTTYVIIGRVGAY